VLGIDAARRRSLAAFTYDALYDWDVRMLLKQTLGKTLQLETFL
jgi:hypothetical protein